jgi:hypothetical protein
MYGGLNKHHISESASVSTNEGFYLALFSFSITSALLALQFMYNIEAINSFKTMHWVWDYSLGFIKRGLPGAATEWLLGDNANSYTNIRRFSTWTLIVLYASYALFSAAVVRSRPGFYTVMVAISGAALQPAFPNLAYDFGRPDHINLILMIIACFAIISARIFVSCLAIIVCGFTATLVHEAFLVTHFPLILLLFLLRLRSIEGLRNRNLLIVMSMVSFPTLSAFAAVWLFGAAPISQPEWNAHWNAQAPIIDRLSEYALTIHYISIFESISLTLSDFSRTRIFFSLLTLSIIFLLAALIWKHLIPKLNSWGKPLCFLMAFTPMLMFLLGVDYLRWVSVITINILIGTLCLMRLAPDSPIRRHSITNFDQLIACDGRRTLHSIILAFGYIYLIFPQSSGIINPRLPERFQSVYGIVLSQTTVPDLPGADK